MASSSRSAALPRRAHALDAGGEAQHHGDTLEPLGFVAGQFDRHAAHGTAARSDGDRAEKVRRSAMATAKAPGTQLFMQAFMLWMSGSSLSIFTIMFVGMAAFQPVQRLLNLGQAFKRYEGQKVDLALPKLIYVGLNLLGVAMALYKVNTLGLLPTSPVDWITDAVRPPAELSSGALLP